MQAIKSFQLLLTTLPLSLSDVKNNDVVPWVLNSILAKYIPSQNPHVRQAACIWLLSMVKKLSQHKEITVCVCLYVVWLIMALNLYYQSKVWTGS